MKLCITQFILCSTVLSLVTAAATTVNTKQQQSGNNQHSLLRGTSRNVMTVTEQEIMRYGGVEQDNMNDIIVMEQDDYDEQEDRQIKYHAKNGGICYFDGKFKNPGEWLDGPTMSCMCDHTGSQKWVKCVKHHDSSTGVVNLKDVIVEEDDEDDDNVQDDDNFDTNDSDIEEEETTAAVQGQEVVDVAVADDEDEDTAADQEEVDFVNFVQEQEGPNSPQVNLEDVIVEDVEEDDDNFDNDNDEVEEEEEETDVLDQGQEVVDDNVDEETAAAVQGQEVVNDTTADDTDDALWEGDMATAVEGQDVTVDDNAAAVEEETTAAVQGQEVVNGTASDDTDDDFVWQGDMADVEGQDVVVDDNAAPVEDETAVQGQEVVNDTTADDTDDAVWEGDMADVEGQDDNAAVEEDTVAVQGQEIVNTTAVDQEEVDFANFVQEQEGPNSPPVNLEDIIVEDEEDDDDALGDDDDVEEETAIEGQEVVDDNTAVEEEDTAAVEGEQEVVDETAVDQDEVNFANFVQEQEGPNSPPVNLEDVIVEEEEDDDNFDGDDVEEETAIEGQEVDDDNLVDDEEGQVVDEDGFNEDDAFAAGDTNSEVSVPDTPEDQSVVDPQQEGVPTGAAEDQSDNTATTVADGNVLDEPPLEVDDAPGTAGDVSVQDTPEEQVVVVDPQPEVVPTGESDNAANDPFAVSDGNDFDDSPLQVDNATGTDTDAAVQDTPEEQVEEPQGVVDTGAAEDESDTANGLISENDQDISTTTSDSENSTARFSGYKDYTCRSINGSSGALDEEYSQYKSVTREWCENECATEVDCKAYDYNEQNMQCQIWYFFYNTYKPQEGSLCYYKKFE